MLYHDMAECPVSYTAWHEFQFATILVVISNASNTEPILECGSSSTCRFLFPLFLHVVLISVFGYCVLMVLFLWSKFIAGPKLVHVAYEVPTRVNFCCTNADNYPRASLYGCATKGMLSASGLCREKRPLVSKTLPFFALIQNRK